MFSIFGKKKKSKWKIEVKFSVRAFFHGWSGKGIGNNNNFIFGPTSLSKHKDFGFFAIKLEIRIKTHGGKERDMNVNSSFPVNGSSSYFKMKACSLNKEGYLG